MAVVCAAGLPHTPVYPAMALAEPTGSIAGRYGAVREVVDAAQPRALVVLSGDHLNSFFLDNLPTFAVHAGELHGPIDRVVGQGDAPLPVAGRLARSIHRHLVTHDFDPALTLSAGVDHGVTVPRWFLDPAGRIPLVVVHVNGILGPLPSARRCYALGRAVADAAAADGERVAVVASGSFSLEVGGPGLVDDRMWAVPAPGWAGDLADCLRSGRDDELLGLVTPDAVGAAGSVAGEVLSWVAMRGAAQGLTDAAVDHVSGEGHAFASWHD